MSEAGIEKLHITPGQSSEPVPVPKDPPKKAPRREVRIEVEIPEEEKAKHLIPFTHVLSLPSKDFRRKLTIAFNYWYKLDEHDLSNIFKLIDLLHNASLIIDDIEDGSELRRGQPAAHIKYGIPLAINAANYIYFEALAVLLEYKNIEYVEVFNKHLLSLHHGQGMELYWRDWEIFAPKDDPRKHIPTEEEFEQVIARKTSGQFLLLTDIMRLLATERKDVNLTSVAFMTGIYFQMRDDLMNLTSDEYKSTKGFCEDISEGKLSFPVIYALNESSKLTRAEKEKLVKILRERTMDEGKKREALKILIDSGALEYTRERLGELKEGIQKGIKDLGGNPTLEMLMKQLWL